MTTNPTILKQSGLKLSVAIDEIAKIVETGTIHVQMLSETTEEMVKEAKRYKEYFNFVDTVTHKSAGSQL